MRKLSYLNSFFIVTGMFFGFAFSSEDVFGSKTSHWPMDSNPVKTKEEFDTIFNQTLSDVENYYGFDPGVGLQSVDVISNLQKLFKYRNFCTEGQLKGFPTEEIDPDTGRPFWNVENSLIKMIYVSRWSYNFFDPDFPEDGGEDTPKANALRDLLERMFADLQAGVAPESEAVVSEKVQAKVDEAGEAGAIAIQVGEGQYLSVDQDGALRADGQTLFSNDVQFSVSSFRKFLGFKSNNFGNKYLQVPSLEGVSQSWSESFKKDRSKISFKSLTFESEEATLEQFELIPVEGLENTFLIRNYETEGFLTLDSDGFVRAYDSSFNPYPDTSALRISLVPLSEFHTEMSLARNSQDVEEKIEIYKSISQDDSKLRTSQDLKLFVSEVKQMLKDSSESSLELWRGIRSKEDDIVDIFMTLRSNFRSEWQNADISAFLIQNLGENPTGLTADEELEQVLSSEIISQDLYQRDIQVTKKYFASLLFTEKVADLKNRLEYLDQENIRQFFLDLSSLVEKSSLIEAFPEDISALSKIIETLEFKDAYIRENQKANSTYEEDLEVIRSKVLTNIGFSEYLENVEQMLDDKRSFTKDEKANFFKKVKRLVDDRAEASGSPDLLNRLVEAISRGLSNQASDLEGQLSSLRTDVLGDLASAVALASYDTRIEDLKDMIRSETFGPGTVPFFLEKLESLAKDRVDGTQGEIDDLIEFINGNEVLKNEDIFFYEDGLALNKIEALAEELTRPVSFSSRVSNLESLVKNRPASAYIDSQGNLIQSADLVDDFINPFIGKLEVLSSNKIDGSRELIDKVISLISFVRSNQMRKSLESVYRVPESEYVGKEISVVLDEIIVSLRGEKLFEDLGYTSQIDFIEDELARSGEMGFDSNAFMDNVTSVVKNRLKGTDADLTRLNEILEEIQFKNNLKDRLYLAKPISEVVASSIEALNNPYTFAFVEGYLKEYVTIAQKEPLSDEEQRDFIEKANILVSLGDFVDLSLINTTIDFLRKAKFNILSEEYRGNIDGIISNLEAKKVDQFQTYSQRISKLKKKVSDLDKNDQNDPSFRIARSIVEEDLRELFIDKIDASEEDVEELKALLEVVRWNDVLIDMAGPYTVSIGEFSAVESGIEDVIDNVFLAYLEKPLSFQDKLRSLQLLRETSSFTDFEKSQFLQRAKALESAFESSTQELLAQAINLLSRMRFNQMDSFKQELGEVIKKLEDQSAYIESLQRGNTDGLTYSQRIMHLDALRLDLSPKTIKKFEESLKELVEDQVKGLKADIELLLAVIEKASKHPMFKTRDYIDYDFNHWRLLISRGVSFEEHLNELIFVLDSEKELVPQEKQWVLGKSNQMISMASDLSSSRANIELIKQFISWIDTASEYQMQDYSTDLKLILDDLEVILNEMSDEKVEVEKNIGEKIKDLEAFVENFITMPVEERAEKLQEFFDNLYEIISDVREYRATNSEADAVRNVLDDSNSIFGIKDLYRNFLDAKGESHELILKSLSFIVNAENVFKFFQDVLTPIEEVISSGFQLSNRDKDWIVESAERLSKNLGILSISSVDDASKLDIMENLVSILKTAIRFSVKDRASSLEPFIKDFEDFISDFQAATSEITENYKVRITNFENWVREGRLNSGNLNEFVGIFSQLVEDKSLAQESDLERLKIFVESPEFKTYDVILWKGGKEAIEPHKNTLFEPLKFEEEYNAFEKLVKLASVGRKDVYHNTVIREKLDYIVENAKLFVGSGVNTSDVNVLIEVLMSDTTFSGYSGSNFSSLEDAINKIKSEVQNVQMFAVVYRDRIERAKMALSEVTSSQDAVGYYSILNALVSKRLEAKDADISELKDLLGRAYYDDNFIQYYSEAGFRAKEKIQELLKQTDSVVTNKERAVWILSTIEADDLPFFYQDIIIDVVSAFVNYVQLDDTGNEYLNELSDALRKSIFYNMSGYKDELTPFIEYISGFIDVAGTKVDYDVKRLERDLDQMSVSMVDLEKFLQNAEILVARKLDLTEEEIKKLSQILNSLKLKTAYINNKDNLLLSGIYVNSKVSSLISTVSKEITFQERYDDLEKLYKLNTFDVSLTSEEKERFVAKARKMLELKNEALFNRDPEKDLLVKLRDILEIAAMNKIVSQKTALMEMVKEVDAYRSEIEGSIEVAYSQRIQDVKSMLKDLRENDVDEFIAAVGSLARDRARGTVEEINEFQQWLISDDVLLQEYIFKADKEEIIRSLHDEFDAYVSFNQRVEELSRMYDQNDSFDRDLKINFLRKVEITVDERGNALKDGVSLDDVEKIIEFVSSQYYGEADSYIEKDNTSKLFRERFSELIEELFSPVDTVRDKSFELRLKDLKDTLNPAIEPLIESDVDAIAFVDKLKRLSKDLVDAVEDDIENFKALLNSNDLLTNEVIFSEFNGFDFIDDIKEELTRPITFVDRVNNLRSFVEKNSIFDDYKKGLFLEKVKILFEQRWRAESEKYNLSNLISLLKVVSANRFDDSISSDKPYIDDLNYYSKNFLTPVSADKEEGFSVYYKDEVEKFKRRLDSLTSENFDEFKEALELLIEKRGSSVFVEIPSGSENFVLEASVLRDWLNSRRVQLNNVIFSGNNREVIRQMAERLIEPVAYKDLYNDLFSIVSKFSFFDSKLKRLFIKKVEKIVALRGVAIEEEFDLKEVVDLIDFAIEQRFADDSDGKRKLEELKIEVKTEPTKDLGFGESYSEQARALARYFAKDSNGNPDYTKLEVIASEVSDFVDGVEALAENRVDGTQEQVERAVMLLKSRSIQQDDVLFKNREEKARLNRAIEKLESPPTYAELTDNFISFIDKNTQFTAELEETFKLKLQRLVEKRGQALAESVDLENLKDWAEFAATNQVSNPENKKIAFDYAKELLTESVTKEKSDYKNFQQTLAEIKELAKSTRKENIQELVNKTLSELVKNRLNFVTFDVQSQRDSLENIETLKKYLDEDLRYNMHIFNTALEAVIDSYLKDLSKEISFAEMFENLKTFIDKETAFSSEHEKAFENKVERIVKNRASGKDADIKEIVRQVNFAKANRFSSSSQPRIDSLIGVLRSKAVLSDQELLRRELEKADAFISGINAENFANVTLDEKVKLIAQLKPLAYNVSANTEKEENKKIWRSLAGARARIFPQGSRDLTGADKELFDQLDLLVGRVDQYK